MFEPGDTEEDEKKDIQHRVYSILEGRHYDAIFKEYATAKGINSACQSCGKGDWWVTPPPKEGFVPGESITAKNAKGEKAVGFAPKMMLSCKNCGFERTYDLFVIAAWLDETQSEGTVK